MRFWRNKGAAASGEHRSRELSSYTLSQNSTQSTRASASGGVSAGTTTSSMANKARRQASKIARACRLALSSGSQRASGPVSSDDESTTGGSLDGAGGTKKKRKCWSNLIRRIWPKRGNNCRRVDPASEEEMSIFTESAPEVAINSRSKSQITGFNGTNDNNVTLLSYKHIIDEKITTTTADETNEPVESDGDLSQLRLQMRQHLCSNQIMEYDDRQIDSFELSTLVADEEIISLDNSPLDIVTVVDAIGNIAKNIIKESNGCVFHFWGKVCSEFANLRLKFVDNLPYILAWVDRGIEWLENVVQAVLFFTGSTWIADLAVRCIFELLKLVIAVIYDVAVDNQPLMKSLRVRFMKRVGALLSSLGKKGALSWIFHCYLDKFLNFAQLLDHLKHLFYAAIDLIMTI